MKQYPLLILLFLACLGTFVWILGGERERSVEVVEPLSASPPTSEAGTSVLRDHSALDDHPESGTLVRQQESITNEEDGFVHLSSTSGLPLGEIRLRQESETLVLKLEEPGRFPIESWRPGWTLKTAGHLPVILGDVPSDMTVSPFREFRVTGVPIWGDGDGPLVAFQDEIHSAFRKDALLSGVVGKDWVMVVSDFGNPLTVTVQLNFPDLRELVLYFSREGGGKGGVSWSYLVGEEPDSLPLECEVDSLFPGMDPSAFVWDMVELTPWDNRDETYLVAKESWGELWFSLPARQPTQIIAGTRALFEGVPLGTEVAVFAGTPESGFGWSGPRIHSGVPWTLQLHSYPWVRFRLLDGDSDKPIPEGTVVRVNWMWGKSKANLVFNLEEMAVGPDGTMAWMVPVDAWSLPIDSPGPYPTKGIQVRVAAPGYEAMQVHMYPDENGLADFQDLKLSPSSWNLVFAHAPETLSSYSYLFFGSAPIPAEGGSLESKARMPLPFSKPVPYGSGWCSIGMDGEQVEEVLRTVTRGVSAKGFENHFYRLSSDGAYHRVPVDSLYEVQMSGEFLQKFHEWYMDVVYSAPSFSLGVASGWKQPNPEPSFQKFHGPKEDVFLKMSPPRGVKAPPSFFPLQPGLNSF